MLPRLDYRPDPKVGTNSNGSSVSWETDLDFRDLAPKLPALTAGDIDLRQYCTETDQEEASSCAGNATADAVEILNAQEEETKALAEGRIPRPPVQLSRMFVYAMARGMMDEDGDGNADIDKDDGTYIRLCFEILSRYGICDEVIWPYDTKKVFTVPSMKALRQATAHRIHSYFRIKEEGEDRIWAIQSALQAKLPVVFGTLVTSAFTGPSGGKGVTSRPTGGTAGGHAMVVVGRIGENFLVKNSWGRKWGDGGYFLMSPDYLTWENTSDLWVPTMGSAFY